MSERSTFPQIIEKEKPRVGFEKEFDVIVGGEGINFRFRFSLLENENGVLMEGEYLWWGSRGSRMDDGQTAIMAAARGMDALRCAVVHSQEFYPYQPGMKFVIEPQVLKIAGLYTAWDFREDLQKLQPEPPINTSGSF